MRGKGELSQLEEIFPGGAQDQPPGRLLRSRDVSGWGGVAGNSGGQQEVGVREKSGELIDLSPVVSPRDNYLKLKAQKRSLYF